MKTLSFPTGVRERHNSLVIDFYYEGKRCREKIEGISKIDQKAIRYAKTKRDTIVVEIKENRFNYRAHFPNSKRGLEFEGATKNDLDRTVTEGVEMYLDIEEEVKADQTMNGYENKAQYVKAYFKNRKMRGIKTNDLTKFRKWLREDNNLATKTINDVFTPLRGTFALAKSEGVLQINPLESFRNLKKAEDDDEVEADPYTQAELDRIIELKDTYHRQQYLNMFLFSCWTGLRLQEAMAIAWEDIDLVDYKIKIRRAREPKGYKAPKEKVSIREFDLLQPAIDILKEQKALTYMQQPTHIKRVAINNVDKTDESIRFVFKNDRPECTDGLIKKKSVTDAYADILRKAKVRHRGANQCRHTFASMLLTKLVPPSLIYPIMGHASEEMLRKHYAKIIPEDRPNVAKIISEIAGLDYENDPHEVTKSA